MTSLKWLLLFLTYDQFLNGNKETNVPMTSDVYYFLLLLDAYYLERAFAPGLTLICSPNWNFFQKAQKKNWSPSIPPNYTLGWKICISIYINEWPLKGKDSLRPIPRKRWRQMSHKTADCLFHSGWACKDDDDIWREVNRDSTFCPPTPKKKNFFAPSQFSLRRLILPCQLWLRCCGKTEGLERKPWHGKSLRRRKTVNEKEKPHQEEWGASGRLVAGWRRCSGDIIGSVTDASALPKCILQPLVYSVSLEWDI